MVIENVPSIRWALMTSASGQSISCECLSFFNARGGNPYRLNSSSSDSVDGDMGESIKMECPELKSMDSYGCATALARVTKAKWGRSPGLCWTLLHTAPGNVRLRPASSEGTPSSSWQPRLSVVRGLSSSWESLPARSSSLG